MKFRQLIATAGIIAGGMLAVGQAPAQAFSFTSNFTHELSGNDAAKGNIWLNSVTLEDGTQLSNFTLINDAKIITNDLYTGGNSGAASADMGDKANGIKVENATSQDIATTLNNTNLNNIIDTEDSGNFAINLFFEQAVDKIFAFERGMNSDLEVQAIDSEGKTLGNVFKFLRSNWNSAGYSIDTQEIGSAQQVGSAGVSLTDLGVDGPISGLRVVSESKFNGPDWKIFGSIAEPEVESAKTPEPSAMLALGAVVGGTLLRRRRQQA